MKKILLFVLSAFCTLAGMAQETLSYTETLVVTVNEETTNPQPTTVLVTNNGDGTINFTLKNFALSSGEDVIPIGNIAIANLPVTVDAEGLYNFEFNDILQIEEGDDTSVDMWLGPMLGPLPLKLVGKLNLEKLYVTIDIDAMDTLGQLIHVQLGTPFPIKGDVNGDGAVTIQDVVAVLEIMAGK